MHKLLLVTNFDEKCGNAADGRMMAENLGKWYEVSCASSLLGVDEIPDVVVVNWHPSRVPLQASDMRRLREMKKKVVVVWQNSHQGPLDEVEATVLPLADAVVAHEKVEVLPSARVLPVGIWEVDGLPQMAEEPTIATCGFPFAWKGFDSVVNAAASLGVRCLLVAPEYPGMNFQPDYARWATTLGDGLTLVTEFLTETQVVRTMARAWVNVFAFRSHGGDDQLGQSGSARMGVAARRPVLLSTHKKLDTLREPEDASYTFEGDIELRNTLDMVIYRMKHSMSVRSPDAIIERQGWSKIGPMYRDLIESIR